MFGSIPFIPGTYPDRPELLGRYLPPIPRGIISTWLRGHLPAGTWVVDPFGACPALAVEAAQAGYRVLVTSINPIARFLVEVEADPPSALALKAALAELSASYVGNDRIEPHIRALYNTTCSHCGQVVSADVFLWEHDKPTPYARVYTCPSCGDSGEHPCTPGDAALASRFSASGLHRARALERVVAYNDQDRIHVEQALAVYSPRALYALITVINKVEGLKLSEDEQKHLGALLLYAFDQANSMWRPQGLSDRHRQLTIPRHYRENNIWRAFEEGINKLPLNGPDGMNHPITVTSWPNLPPVSGGICVYEGRLASIIDSIKNIEIKSMCAAIPRPNQPFWTLSALWAGWLWGREAVGKFKSVLHRQRYDWAWHTSALNSVFSQLASCLEENTPILGLIGEAEPGFLGASLIAANLAGFSLESIATRPEQNQAQISWRSSKQQSNKLSTSGLTQPAIQSARRYLELAGEPASYISTITAALSGIIQHWQLEQREVRLEQVKKPINTSETDQTLPSSEPSPAYIYSTAYNSAREALSYRSGFIQFSPQDEPETKLEQKTQNVQASLFKPEVEKTFEISDEESMPESAREEEENTFEKERPMRSSDVTESTLLWIRETGEENYRSVSDRYELVMAEFLINHPGISYLDINKALCEEFPGLLTPDESFINLCLHSYGVTEPNNPDQWFIRPEDKPSEREADMISITNSLHQIGTRLGFDCFDQHISESSRNIRWREITSQHEYWFFVTTHATIGECVTHGNPPVMRGYIVYPGSRADLLAYKLRRDPRINRAFNPSFGIWHFLKFRHLRSLTESPMLNRENLEQMLGLDPLTFSTPQLWLI